MNLLTATILLLLYVLFRSSEIAIMAGIARDYIRAIAYGLLALLVLIFLVLKLV